MEGKYFLVQIKRTSNTYEKGVVVKDTLADARQSYHAYLGAYGYGHDPNTDYVQCEIISMAGEICDAMIDNRIQQTGPEQEA